MVRQWMRSSGRVVGQWRFGRQAACTWIPLAMMAFALAAPALRAGTLYEAAQIVGRGVNGRAPNDNLVRFDQVYRVNAHNTYNPRTWPDLETALTKGVRSIELDVYNFPAEFTGIGVTRAQCDAVGGTYDARAMAPGSNRLGVCRNFDRQLGATALVASLQDAIAGRPIATRAGQDTMKLAIQHAPTDEDNLMAGIASLLRNLPVIGSVVDFFLHDDYYGANCSNGTAQNVGGMQTQLAQCLQHIRTWSDLHPNHTPIVLYFDIKNEPSPLAAVAFDATLRGMFGSKLYTPKDLQGRFASPREAAMAGAWPTMASLRGRVVALYSGGEVFQLIGRERPNNTMRFYVDGLRSLGFSDPAAFVCVRTENAADVDHPDSFGRGDNVPPESIGRLMGQVACHTFYTGEHATAQQTNARAYETTVAGIRAARSRNLFTHVFSYNDPLANEPATAMDLIRNGANLIEQDYFKDAPVVSPLEMFHDAFLPYEGLSSITNWSFFIRQQNSPFVLQAMGAPQSVGSSGGTVRPYLQPYSGRPSQQWSMTNAGQLFALSNPSQCVQPAVVTEVIRRGSYRDGFKVRPNSVYTTVTPNGFQISPYTPTFLGACNDGERGGFFTLRWATAFNNGGPNGNGVLIALNPSKHWQTIDLYLTPGGYSDTDSTYLVPRNDDHITQTSPMDMGRLERAADSTFRAAMNGPLLPALPNLTYRQEYTLGFDSNAAVVVDSTLSTTPPLSWISLPPETNGGVPKPPTWRDYPLKPESVVTVSRDPTLSPTERAIWMQAWVTDRLADGRIARNAAHFTDVARDASITVDLFDAVGNVVGRIPYQAIASAILPHVEYQKWLAAADTTALDVPRADLSAEGLAQPENLLLLKTAYALMTDFVPGPDDPPRTAPTNCAHHERFCAWWRREPEVSAPFPYWSVPLKASNWYIASQVLEQAEYDKWRQALNLKPSDIPLDPELTEMARELLEGSQPPSKVGIAANDEFGAWLADQRNCTELLPGDWPFTKYEKCPGRFLTQQPGHGPRFQSWNEIQPFDDAHYALAEAAFLDPHPGSSGPLNWDQWFVWQWAYGLQHTVSGRPLRYTDVPFGAQNEAIVSGSNLLSRVEKAKYFESLRVLQMQQSGSTIDHFTIVPDGNLHDVAAQYLSEQELALWEELVAVNVDDIPLNMNVMARVRALLSPAEVQQYFDRLSDPKYTQAAFPELWPDLPPVRTRRSVAEVLLDPAQYGKWQEALVADEDDFPQVWTNDSIGTLAEKTLSADELATLRERLGSEPPSTTGLNWLMLPHRASARVIAEQVLPSDQFATWVDMQARNITPAQLGRSKAAAAWARSVLPASAYGEWLAQASNVPLDANAFHGERSIVQQRIVEAIFGADSGQAQLWRAWAGFGEVQ